MSFIQELIYPSFAREQIKQELEKLKNAKHSYEAMMLCIETGFDSISTRLLSNPDFINEVIKRINEIQLKK